MYRLPNVGRRPAPSASTTPRPKSPPVPVPRYYSSSPAPRPQSIASTLSHSQSPDPVRPAAYPTPVPVATQPDLFYRVNPPAGAQNGDPPVIRTPEDVVALLKTYRGTNVQ